MELWQPLIAFALVPQCPVFLGFNIRTTLHSSIYNHLPWSHQDFALIMARSQPYVHTLELYVNAGFSLDRSEKKYGDIVEVPTNHLRDAILPVALQTLKVEVVKTAYNLVDGLTIMSSLPGWAVLT